MILHRKRILANEFILCVMPPNIFFWDCIFSFVAIATLKYKKNKIKLWKWSVLAKLANNLHKWSSRSDYAVKLFLPYLVINQPVWAVNQKTWFSLISGIKYLNSTSNPLFFFLNVSIHVVDSLTYFLMCSFSFK